MNITLKDGYEVSIDEKSFSDWRFLTTLRKIDKGETGLIVDIAEKLLGSEEEVEKLAQHFEVDGYISSETMISAIQEIIESVSELKNL